MFTKERRGVRKVTPIILVLLAMCSIVGCGSGLMQILNPPTSPVNMIYDDDCDGDIDCATTQPIIHHSIDSGYVKIWGMVSSAPSRLGAPTMKVFQNYYGHKGLFPIGAAVPACALLNSAPWYIVVVNQFDPGDVCTNYTSCGTVLRQSVQSYIDGGGAANGLVYVITGPLTCEEEFRSTSADSISPLTGAQMMQKYVKEFVLMNGAAPSGGESNCHNDAPACSGFFANVTSQNGYPPVYVVPVNTGALNVEAPTLNPSIALTSPSAYAARSPGAPRVTLNEDAMAFEFAILGPSGWKISVNSTNSVDADGGGNSWSSDNASGQYYLSTASSPLYFERILALL